MRGRVAYSVASGTITVKARSSIHDTVTRWGRASGSIEMDPEAPGDALAEIKVDMREFDAGDRLKNWKIKGDLEPDKHPWAVFKLERLEGLVDEGGGRWRASARGSLAWRGRTAPLLARGSAVIGPTGLEASCTFDLDVTSVGVTPPKILFMKVEPVVSVEVSLRAAAASASAVA